MAADPALPSPTGAPPPHYGEVASTLSIATSSSHQDTFFDIVPQADQTSFQVGYLGLPGFRAWIKGDVLIKRDQQARTEVQGYRRCTIALRAIESDQQQSIVLFSEDKVLWQREPSTNGDVEGIQTLPSTLPFSFLLTDDLPHCIHAAAAGGALEYRLEATLSSGSDMPHAEVHRSTQVHLTRYSRPGRLREVEGGPGSMEAYLWQVDDPTPIRVQLLRTLFRRAEPITVLVRIPPPQRKMLLLNLRSVEANLVRIITTKSNGAKQEVLMAHSGKLCRFHSTRDVVLRLQLHPPFDASNMPYPHPDHDAAQGGPIHGRGGGGGCESITQDTVLHAIHFVVRISIAIRSNDVERRDVTLEREVTILPGAAGAGVEEGDEDQLPAPRPSASASTSEKQPISYKSKAQEAIVGSSTSSALGGPIVAPQEEEYDGYEDVGRSLTADEDDEDGYIDAMAEDGPPPTILESQHDLQVEVDVEGVGPGVPRDLSGAEATGSTSAPLDYVWHASERGLTGLHGELEDLPPPPTPPIELEQVEDGLGPPPSVSEADGDVATYTHRASDAAHQPPPYVSASLRAARHPSGVEGDSSSARRPSMPLTLPGDGDLPPPNLQHSDAAPSADESFPPAYAHPPQGQHPPSYEA